MSIAVPTVRFSIGSSTATTAPMKSKSLVDMSLDDLIKARRTEDKTTNKSAQESKKADTLKKKRVSIKSAANAKSKKPTAAQKSIGTSKAKRGANTAARRGISPSPQPTAMQIEKEVKRQLRNEGTRQSTRIRDNTNRNVEGPPKNAIDAALKAMTKFGYKPPQGMRIVISFAPTNSNVFSGDTNKGKKNLDRDQGSSNQQQQRGNNQQQQRGNNQQQRRGRGKGGRLS